MHHMQYVHLSGITTRKENDLYIYTEICQCLDQDAFFLLDGFEIKTNGSYMPTWVSLLQMTQVAKTLMHQLTPCRG